MHYKSLVSLTKLDSWFNRNNWVTLLASTVNVDNKRSSKQNSIASCESDLTLAYLFLLPHGGTLQILLILPQYKYIELPRLRFGRDNLDTTTFHHGGDGGLSYSTMKQLFQRQFICRLVTRHFRALHSQSAKVASRNLTEGIVPLHRCALLIMMKFVRHVIYFV